MPDPWEHVVKAEHFVKFADNMEADADDVIANALAAIAHALIAQAMLALPE